MKPSDFLLDMEQPFTILCEHSDEEGNNVDLSSETDPLQEFEADESALATKPRFYRMNSIVFAEPLKSMVQEENSSKDETEITIIENVIVHTKTGKKYKNQFNIEDAFLTRCAQPNCLRTFPTMTQLISHIRRVHCVDRKRYVCEQCGRGFPERYMLIRHTHTHSDKTVECPVCGVRLRLRTSLSTHLRSHSNLRPHECDVCKKTFTRASSKAKHIKFVHREGLLDCKDCDKRFASRKQWSLHMATHREKNT